MGETKFTPGPWEVVDRTDLGERFWIEVEHPEVGNVSLAAVRGGCDEADEIGDDLANAHLIAAAPDLYAELDGLAKEIWGAWTAAEADIRSALGNTNYNVVKRRLEQAQIALAKARGES